MRAVWLREFGGPEQLVAEETPDPVPEPGQVLIEVAYANVVFVETQVRAGHGPFPVRLPVIPGNGVGGSTVDGQRVVSGTGGSGGYASRVAVPDDAPLPVPDGLSLDGAVALMADGRTALLLSRLVPPVAGQRVLVEAAAGGVGGLLVQLAVAAGAEVVAAAGGPRKLALARELGAHQAVDYNHPQWTDEVGDLDVVYDGVGGDIARAAYGRLRRGGQLLSYGLASGHWVDIPAEDAQARGVQLRRSPGATPAELRALTREALALGAAGQLRPVIGQRYPLEQAAAAHAAIESRATVGKTLLTVAA